MMAARRTRRYTRRIRLSLSMLFLLLLLGSCRSQPVEGASVTRPPSPLYGIDFLEKASPEHIRIMSFNVGWDSIFPADDPLNDMWRQDDTEAEFVRILRAIEPDILCLQEINPYRDPQQVGDILDAVLPLDNGEVWRTHSGQDNVIAARFDLTMQASEFVHRSRFMELGHAMALVDLPDAEYEQDLYVICAHFQSQGGEANIQVRQDHADAISAWIGDARTPGGEIDVPDATGMVVLGDFNVYDTDPAHHLTTLLSGDIADEERYGHDIAPDWDETDLADALPRQNGVGEDRYTWRDDTSVHDPGILDRILYTDSVLTVESSFVLNTTIMAQEELETVGLQSGDVMLDPERGRYDHLPLVVDLSFRALPSEP